MTTFRSNNSKNINPISKYFTDLKNSDKFELIKHSQSSLRSLILLLIIVCKNGSGRIFLSHRRCQGWISRLLQVGRQQCQQVLQPAALVLPAVVRCSHRSSRLLLFEILERLERLCHRLSSSNIYIVSISTSRGANVLFMKSAVLGASHEATCLC